MLGPGSAACITSWTGGKTNSSVGDRRIQTHSFIIHRPPDFGPVPVPLWMPVLRLKWETKIALEWFKDLTKPLVPGAWRDKREQSCHYCCIVSRKKGRGAWNRMLACPRGKKSQLKQACMHVSLYRCCQGHGLSCSFYAVGLQVNCKILFIGKSFHLPQMFIEFLQFLDWLEKRTMNELLISHYLGSERKQISYNLEVQCLNTQHKTVFTFLKTKDHWDLTGSFAILVSWWDAKRLQTVEFVLSKLCYLHTIYYNIIP